MSQRNPKPTLYADRAAVTSDRVTLAAKRASSVPTADPPASATATLVVVTVPASATTDLPSTAVPAVTMSLATVVPTPIPTLVPVSATIVAALTEAPAAAAKAPTVAKAAGPASKATTSSAAKATAVPTVIPAARPAAAPTTTVKAAVAVAPAPPTTALPAAVDFSTITASATAMVPLGPKPPWWPPRMPPSLIGADDPILWCDRAHCLLDPCGRAHSPGPDFPPISASGNAPPKSHARKCKENKGKGKAKDLNVDLNRAIKLSIGQKTDVGTGASSSRCAATHAIIDGTPTSPKHLHTNSAARNTPTSPLKQHCADEGEYRDGQKRRQAEPHPRFNCLSPTFDTLDGKPPHGSFVPFHEHLTRVIYGLSTCTLYHNHPAHQLSHILIRSPGLAENNGPDPIAWLIAGIDNDQAQALINMGYLCSDMLTIFFHEYHPPISGFMGTWQGFAMAKFDTDLAHCIIVDTACRSSHHPLYKCLKLFGDHIITLPINLLSPRSPFVAWNPTNDEEPFNALHGLFQHLVLDTTFHGQGRIYTHPLHCNICLSIDHPTNLCLLLSIPGWLGPTPETISALLDTTHKVLNPRTKKSGSCPCGNKNKGKGKGKDHNDCKGDRKGGDCHRGN
ncbi:hypothetical protein B0H14DRAFT_3460540 [Mycena olivaceomarginata]|nr:hypothetical protein B0H14DRAFT_3460540 [Mycena olivaceomarginata]